MKVAISFIGTGKYLDFLPKWYEFVERNFLPGVEKKILVFTDGEMNDVPENLSVHFMEHKEWPYITLERFETLLKVRNEIEECDWFIFLDADTLVVKEVNPKDIFDDTKPYIGVHHPCAFLNMTPHNQYPGSFETNPLSTAKITEDDDTSVYYQGCVWGGKVPEVFEMMEILSENINLDLEKEIIAKWDDESHLNKFYASRKEQVKILPSSYVYPLDYQEHCNFQDIIVHAKDFSKYHI